MIFHLPMYIYFPLSFFREEGNTKWMRENFPVSKRDYYSCHLIIRDRNLISFFLRRDFYFINVSDSVKFCDFFYRNFVLWKKGVSNKAVSNNNLKPHKFRQIFFVLLNLKIQLSSKASDNYRTQAPPLQQLIKIHKFTYACAYQHDSVILASTSSFSTLILTQLVLRSRKSDIIQEICGWYRDELW